MTDFSAKKFRELNDAYKSMYAPAPVEEESAVEEIVDSETEVECLPDLVENLPAWVPRGPFLSKDEKEKINAAQQKRAAQQKQQQQPAQQPAQQKPTKAEQGSNNQQKWYPPVKKPSSGWNFVGNYIDAMRNAASRREFENQQKRRKEAENNTPPAGAFNISPKGSARRNELEAQIKRDNAARTDDQRVKTKEQPQPQQPQAQPQQPQPQAQPQQPQAQPQQPKVTAQPKIRDYGSKAANMAAWAKANPKLAQRLADKNKSTANRSVTGSGTMKSDLGGRLGAALSGKTSDFKFKESYDVVLEYLLSGGHAETVEEAHYIMMEMDQNTIKNICEGTQES